MHIIRAEFRRLNEVSLFDAYDELGVYVLWNGHGQVRPSYIGEGEVMKRFAAHLAAPWARPPLDGVIWINPHGTHHEAKMECELIECALLALADDVDRDPIHNKSRGRPVALRRVLDRFGGRRVRVNRHGLRPTLSARELADARNQGAHDLGRWTDRAVRLARPVVSRNRNGPS